MKTQKSTDLLISFIKKLTEVIQDPELTSEEAFAATEPIATELATQIHLDYVDAEKWRKVTKSMSTDLLNKMWTEGNVT